MAKKKKNLAVIGVAMIVLALTGFTVNIMRKPAEKPEKAEEHICAIESDGFCSCGELMDAETALKNKTDWREVEYNETEAVTDGFYRAYFSNQLDPFGTTSISYVMDENANVAELDTAPYLMFDYTNEFSCGGVMRYYRFTHTDGSRMQIEEKDIDVLSNVKATYEGGQIMGYIDLYFENPDFDEEGYTGKLYLTTNGIFSKWVKLK